MTCPTEEEGPTKVAGTGWLRWLEKRWSHQVWEAEKELAEPRQGEGRRLRWRSGSWTLLWNDPRCSGHSLGTTAGSSRTGGQGVTRGSMRGSSVWTGNRAGKGGRSGARVPRVELGGTPAGPRIPTRAALLSSKPARSLRRIKPATSGLFPWPTLSQDWGGWSWPERLCMPTGAEGHPPRSTEGGVTPS